MGLYFFELSKELGGCGPEARFLLEAMALRAQLGVASDLAVGVKTLAKELRLAEKLVRMGLAELESAQLVVLQRSEPRRRGRPSIRYQIAPIVMEVSQKEKGAYGVHSELLVRLFSAGDFATAKHGAPKQSEEKQKATTDGRPAPPGAASYFSAGTRLLLATLLANSDELGKVTGISKVKLRQLTGFDEVSLRHRLRRLMSLKLVLVCVPGLASKIFPGARIRSTYFLDITHPSFGGVANTVSHHVGSPDVSSPTPAQIFRPDLNGKYGAQDHPVRRFLPKERDAVFDVLRHLVLQYASHLLSYHRVEVSSIPPAGPHSLREKIAGDFQRPASWTVGDEAFDLNWAKVVDHFYQLAFRVARDFNQSIDSDCSFDQVSLVPSDGRFQYIFWLNMDEGRARAGDRT